MTDELPIAAWSAPWAHALAGLGVATAAGFVVGLERERSAQDKDQQRFAGLRTLALVGLCGGVAGLLGTVWGVGVPLLFLFGVGGLSLLASWTTDRRGVTTEVSTLAVALMGLTATTPLPDVPETMRYSLVGAAALITMALLSLKGPLHALARAATRDELVQVAQLGLLLLVALPLLPDVDLWGVRGLNPYETAMMVALIAGISLTGYLAVRRMGPGRGMAAAGMLGGLVSSTAVTLGFAGRCSDDPRLVGPASRGIVLACVIMFPRQLLEIGVVAPSLLGPAAIPLGVMTAVGLLAVGLTFRRQDSPSEGADRLKNPGSMAAGLKFGALYAVVVAASGEAHRLLGPEGLYVSAFLSGLADVDAITLSVGRLSAHDLETTVAVRALTLAALTNTVVKIGLASAVGGRALGKAVAWFLVPAVLAGGLTALLL